MGTLAKLSRLRNAYLIRGALIWIGVRMLAAWGGIGDPNVLQELFILALVGWLVLWDAQFIREQTDVVYAIIIANFGQAFLLIGLGLLFIPLLANVIRVPMNFLVPSVLAMAIFGSFGLTGDLSGPLTVLVFSIVGWFFKRYDYSVPAAVIGILLGLALIVQVFKLSKKGGT